MHEMLQGAFNSFVLHNAAHEGIREQKKERNKQKKEEKKIGVQKQYRLNNRHLYIAWYIFLRMLCYILPLFCYFRVCISCSLLTSSCIT